MYLLVAVGLAEEAVAEAFEVMRGAGGARLELLPAAPTRAEFDRVLDSRDGATLAVAGSDAGLNATVQRLYRRGESATVATALLPVAGSAVAPALGLPADPAEAARVAVSGRAVLRGLVRDDHGGVLLGSATLQPWDGGTAAKLGLRAYADEHPIADGEVRGITLRAGNGHVASYVSRGPTRRGRRARSRAVTVSCAPARLTVDGEVHSRPQIRRTWWHDPDRLLLVLPSHTLAVADG